MAVTTITFTLAGDDANLSVTAVSEMIEQSLQAAERRGVKPMITVGGGNTGMAMAFEINPGTLQISRLGREVQV